MTELSRLKISEARDKLGSGEITSLDLTEACLAEIETAGELNAFVHRTPEIAVEQAKRADARIAAGNAAPMTGIPLGIKDLFCTKGVPSQAASAILTETVVPKIDDWDEFYSYIQENEAFHLLQRRPSTAACRETLEAGEQIAGVSTFTKRAISLRKIT